MEIAYFERRGINGLFSNPLILLESRLWKRRDGSSLLEHALSHSRFLSSLFIHSVFFWSPFPFLLLYSLYFYLFFLSCYFPHLFFLTFCLPPIVLLPFYCTQLRPFLYCLPWRVLLFYPLTTFSLVWVSFPNHPLFCQLLSHHHYTVLAAPYSIPRQKVLFCFFAFRSILIQIRVRYSFLLTPMACI